MDMLCIGFFASKLNDLKCCVGDVGSAYFNSKTKEKVFIISGPEFGLDLEGSILIVIKALYRLLNSAALFHKHLSDTLHSLGFRQSVLTTTSGYATRKSSTSIWHLLRTMCCMEKRPHGVYACTEGCVHHEGHWCSWILPRWWCITAEWALEQGAYLHGILWPDVHQECHSMLWDSVSYDIQWRQHAHGGELSSRNRWHASLFTNRCSKTQVHNW